MPVALSGSVVVNIRFEFHLGYVIRSLQLWPGYLDVIFGGCENGEVVQWNLSETYLKELGIPRASLNGHKQPAYNGRRTLRYGTYRAKELLPSR